MGSKRTRNKLAPIHQKLVLQPFSIVQIHPKFHNPNVAGCLATVVNIEPENNHVSSIILCPGRGVPDGHVVHLKLNEFEVVGKVAWVPFKEASFR